MTWMRSVQCMYITWVPHSSPMLPSFRPMTHKHPLQLRADVGAAHVHERDEFRCERDATHAKLPGILPASAYRQTQTVVGTSPFEHCAPPQPTRVVDFQTDCAKSRAGMFAKLRRHVSIAMVTGQERAVDGLVAIVGEDPVSDRVLDVGRALGCRLPLQPVIRARHVARCGLSERSGLESRIPRERPSAKPVAPLRRGSARSQMGRTART